MVQIIECNPQILGGKPVIKGTRIPVDLLFELVRANVSIEEILEDYPSLTKEVVEKVMAIGDCIPQLDSYKRRMASR